MAGWIPPRLSALLGDDLLDLSAEGLAAVIGLAEDVDLDFKRDAWSRSDGGTKEAAYDVAAFANAGGGLLLVGVDEDGSGTASDLVGIDAAADLSLWLDQVVAARIAPPPTVTQTRIALEEREVLVVAVEPSVSGPHAVAVGDGALRYPTRLGSLRRYLTEAEVADRYRRRMNASTAIAEHLDALIDEVDSIVDPPNLERHGDAWLAVGLVPDVEGHLELRRGIDEQWRTWVDPEVRRYPCYGPRKLIRSTFGFQSIDLHDGLDAHTPYLGAGRFWTDGRGLILFGYDRYRPTEETTDIEVPDEHLLGDLINGVAVLAGHASRTGASGAANLVAKLGWGRYGKVVLSEHRSMFPGPIDGLRRVRKTGVARRTVGLDSLHNGVGQLGAVRLLAGDLLSSFGWPEPQQITAELQLVRRRTYKGWWPQMEAWAEANGVEVIDNFAD